MAFLKKMGLFPGFHFAKQTSVAINCEGYNVDNLYENKHQLDMIIFPRSTCFRLSLMMFFQYMLFAVWWAPLAAYLTHMNVDGTQKALTLSSLAVAVAMIVFFRNEKEIIS